MPASYASRDSVDRAPPPRRCRVPSPPHPGLVESVLEDRFERPSELTRYRPEHSNRTAQTLVAYTGKGGRTRTIPLSAPAAEALADLEAMGAIGPFSTSTVRRAFVRAAVRIGIHGVRPYDLRHSYGTALYRVAGDTRLVKDVLGHSDTRMTERYTLGHVPEAMRLATSRFEKHLEVPDAPPAAVKRAARGAGG